MSTKPHSNPKNGYSIRIGKNLPENAANLAYIHTDSPTPSKNLSVINLAQDIPENRERDAEISKDLYTTSLENTNLHLDDIVTIRNLTYYRDIPLSNYQNESSFRVPLIQGHKYYLRRKVDFNLGEWNMQTGKIVVKETRFEMIGNFETEDVLFEYTGATTLNATLRMTGNYVPNKKGEQLAYFNFMTLIDLTESFGAGKEKNITFMRNLCKNKFFNYVQMYIAENAANNYENIYTDILMENGQPVIVPNEDIVITNEFTLNKFQTPLYYIHSLNYEYNMRNEEVSYYINGKTKGKKVTFNKINPEQMFNYETNQIKVTKNDYEELSHNEVYKIVGIPSMNEGMARLYLLTNFKNDKLNTYRVQYNAQINNKSKYHTEVINTRTIFIEENGTPVDNYFMRSYHLVPLSSNKSNKIRRYNNQGFYIQLKAEGQVKEQEINGMNRSPYLFNYQIRSQLDVRFSDRNPIDIKIGHIHVNENQRGVLPLGSAMKKLLNKTKFPNYISFSNPHYPAGDALKESTSYWSAYLEMPEEHYLDYDILFLTGYGEKDYKNYNSAIKAFVESGGTLIIDNNSLQTPISFNDTNHQHSFFFDIEFSNNPISNHLIYKKDSFNDRYFYRPELLNVGDSLSTIQFKNNLNIEDFDVHIASEQGQPALATKKYGAGKIVVSNMGLMSQIILGNENVHKMLSNFLIYNAEHRGFVSPIFKDYVIHKDDLFEEDYTDYYGNQVYINAPNDYDSTQIIARKILGGRTGEVAKKYLPSAYQNPYGSMYYIESLDRQLVPLENMDFEAESTTKVFNDNAAQSIPGFRYVIESKGPKSEGGLSTDISHLGRYSLYLDYTNTKGFFEKEINNLEPGNYKLEGYVKSENYTGGGFSVYDSNIEEIKSNESITGTTNWRTLTLHFEKTDNLPLYLRLGSSLNTASGKIYFDDLILTREGNVRMTPDNGGELELYAYALEPKGQNTLLGYMNNSDFTVVRSDMEINPTIRIRSFVYSWDTTSSSYQKQYGKNSYIKTKILASEGEKVVDKLINIIPTNESGFQWSYPQNIFYQIEIDPDDPYYDFANVSIYDPYKNEYYFSRNGQWIINREDLWADNTEPTTQLRISSKLDNLKITGAKYTLVKLKDKQIELVEPNTNKERDRWYPRIHNGSFVRHIFNQKDIEQLSNIGMENYNNEYVVGEHHYSLPEYHRQTFYPRKGERLIDKEDAIYVNPNLIQLQKAPIVIKERILQTPLYNFDGDRKTFRATDTFWDPRYPVEVYLDEQLVNEGYEINFEEGFIKFNRVIENTATVFAKYAQNNIRIFRRKLSNNKIEKELLTRIDDNSMRLSKENIATSPAPIFYREGNIINPNEYWIDFENGILNFYQNNRKNILASYSYYIYEELTHVDINAIKGEVSIKEEIHFLDEIVVDYIYQEDYLEYKGYYDNDQNIFVHLDLNPTAGHTFTSPVYNNLGMIQGYQEESSEKLLNKIIYFYMLPQYSKYINKVFEEKNTIRHCFSEKEWNYIKGTTPAAILIGKILVRENTNINNVVLLDARRPGGGIKETISNEIINKKIGYSSALWDIGSFDGLSYYRNGVTIIRIPNTILKSNGGKFTEEDVRNIIDKYLALGVYPIIEYVEPNIGNVPPGHKHELEDEINP